MNLSYEEKELQQNLYQKVKRFVEESNEKDETDYKETRSIDNNLVGAFICSKTAKSIRFGILKKEHINNDSFAILNKYEGEILVKSLKFVWITSEVIKELTR